MARTQHQHQQAPAAPQQTQAQADSAASAPAMRVSRHARRGAGAAKAQAGAPSSTGTSAAGARQELRTKVVVRHLPPTMGAGSLAEELEARFGGMYTWMAFRAGKASHKRQVHGVAYLNFRRPEDVLRFYEEFDGHVFVNEKGAQYKAMVEYAPYQRVPKPRSKKDVREGTIFKDPDYLLFVETLGKPQEFLPSAEVQLERREAEKAAAGVNGVKEAVVVTPLMEFVRQRRAAKAAPQRSMSMSAKLASRLGSGGMKISVRGEKAGLLSELEPTSSRAGGYEGSHGSGSRREEQQRREREVERRRKEPVEGKEKKLVREAVAAALSSTRGSPRGDSSAEHLGKDSGTDASPADVEFGSRGPSPGGVSGDAGSKSDFSRRKQLAGMKDKEKDALMDSGAANSAGSGAGGAYSHRSRPPQSPKHGSSQAAHTGGAASASKPSHGKEAGARGSRGMASNQLSLLQPISPQIPLQAESQSQQQPQQQQSFQQTDRGKRPPRPASRVSGKEQLTTLSLPVGIAVDVGTQQSSSAMVKEDNLSNQGLGDAFLAGSRTDKQDARRVRNKDRPDRPVWTPRRRADSVPGTDSAPTSSSSINILTTSHTASAPSQPANFSAGSGALAQPGSEIVPKADRSIRSLHHRSGGKLSTGQVFVTVDRSTDSLQADSIVNQGDFSLENASPSSRRNRYPEQGGIRTSRAGRTTGTNSIMENLSAFEVDGKIDPHTYGALVDANSTSLENGEAVSLPTVMSTALKDRRKQDSSLCWNDTTATTKQVGRRDRNSHQVPKDTDGFFGVPDPSKSAKRGGAVSLGGSEKQVWVAVQKSGTGS